MTTKKQKSPLSGKVQTVLGPIEPSDLGVTMTHEHLLVHGLCYMRNPEEATLRAYEHAPVTADKLGDQSKLFWNSRHNFTLYDEKFAVAEALKYKHAGGQSFVDTTSRRGTGRDPLGLARISRATGINIVMGGSYYVPLSYPPGFDKKPEDEIYQEIVQDITVGADGTGVRSGIIGEVGNFYPLTANERKVLRASARAAAATGAPITIHPAPHDDSHYEIINILSKSGADPKRVVMGHLDFTLCSHRPALKRLAGMGCFLEFDTFGWENTTLSVAYPGLTMVSDVQRIEAIEFLIAGGHLDQIVVAQDICQKWMTTKYGGKGYAHVLENIVPRLRKRGWTQQQLDAVLIHNPARALTFA